MDPMDKTLALLMEKLIKFIKETDWVHMSHYPYIVPELGAVGPVDKTPALLMQKTYQLHLEDGLSTHE